jgi:hypothetical protein
METYVAHIHNWYWWKLNNRPVNAADVQTVLKVGLGSDDPFVRLVGGKIAGFILDGTLDQVDKLRAYVDGQPYLRSIVAREDRRHHTGMEVQAHKAKRVARREARSAQLLHASTEHEGDISGAIERKERDATIEHIEKVQKDSAIWETKRQEETELSKSLQAKMRLGKNAAVVTRAEARYYERIKGKRCPYKISS